MIYGFVRSAVSGNCLQNGKHAKKDVLFLFLLFLV